MTKPVEPRNGGVVSRSPFVRVLTTLWEMLSTRRRLIFVALVVAVFVASVLDMCGMLLIFGFISGLQVNADGSRSGRLMRLLDLVLDTHLDDLSYAMIVGGLVVGVMGLKNLLSTVVQFSLNRFLMKLNQSVSLELFKGYLLAPYESIVAKGAGGPRSNISRIFEIFSSCFESLARILADGTLLLIVVVLLFFVNPTVTLIAAGLFGIVGVGLYWIMQKTLVRMGRQEKRQRRVARAYLADGMNGIVETRIRDARPALLRGYARALAGTALLRRRVTALKRLPRSSNEMLFTLMLVGTVFYLASSGQTLADILPTLALFGFAGLRLTGATTRLNISLQNLRRRAEEFERFVRIVIQLAPQVLSEKDVGALASYLVDEKPLPKGRDGRLHDALIGRNLSFRYPNQKTQAIEEVSVTVPKGAFVSFCGPSGGGKSTLALLLMGLLKPETGDIVCDDWSIFEHIRIWHKNLGYVGQNSYVTQRSIRQNIAFAVPDEQIDDEKVWRALTLASADGFVRSLPKKLDHVLIEGGTNLSGGQRQRLMIARALYDDPEIVIFDEATAALDNVTEREITRAIFALSGTKTIICIAHRLSTIEHSDIIHVVEGGKISASGTYAELLKTSETFRDLAHGPNPVTQVGSPTGNN